MKIFIVLAAVAFICVESGSRNSKPGKPDYFWKEYNGHVPSDALKVAQNGTDVPVYIGQGYFEGVGLLPGMINPGVMELKAVANGRVYTINRNIKIMATDSTHPDRDFQWIDVNYENLDSLASLHFLNLPSGGTETSTTVFIGRHSEPGYTNVGKIYTVAPYQGLTIPNAQGKVTVYKNFEVLALLNFNCDESENGNNSGESDENSHNASPLSAGFYRRRNYVDPTRNDLD